MSFKVGSINMYKFSLQSNEEINKDLQKIANVLLEEEFDIVALQEVFNDTAVHRLLGKLGASWECVWEAPISKSRQSAEGYAFIWNTRRFRLATTAKRGEKSQETENTIRTFSPRIHSTYKEDEFLYRGKLIRDPFFARFEALYGWYEVRLINTHIIYNEASDKMSRKHELSILADIYSRLEDKQYRNSRRAYTILLGDYNLSLLDIDKNAVNGEAIIEVKGRTDKDKKVLVTIQDELTTLKARSPKEPDVPATGYANSFDHFTLDKKNFRHVSYTASRIDSVHSKYWNGDFELHKKEFSDHVPISLTVEFR